MNPYHQNLLSRAQWPKRTAPDQNILSLLQQQAHTVRQLARNLDDIEQVRLHIKQVFELDDQIKQMLFGISDTPAQPRPL